MLADQHCSMKFEMTEMMPFVWRELSMILTNILMEIVFDSLWAKKDQEETIMKDL